MDASPIDPTAAPAAAPTQPVLPPRIRRRSPAAAAVLGWAVPGLGQLYAGSPGKALLMMAAIGGLFYGGLAMTGFTCVDPNTYGLEFVAHAWIGAPTAWAYWHGRDIVLSDPMPYFEVGRLYVAVGGLLNIVAVCDALDAVLKHNVRAADRKAERDRILTAHDEAVLVAAAPSLAPPPIEPEVGP